MKCVKCGMELNASMLRPDGALECPNCGAIYRKKKSPQPDSPKAVSNGQRTNRYDQALHHAVTGAETVLSSLNRAAQYGKEIVDNARDDPNVQKAAEAYRAGKAKVVAGAVDAYESGKAGAKRVINTASNNVPKCARKRTFIAIFLALIAVLGIGLGIHSISNQTGGFSLGIFESKEQREVQDLLDRLEKAYNKQDVYALLQLYDPTYTDAMFGMLSLFGIDGDALKSMLPFASQFISQYNTQYSSTDSGKIKARLLDYNISGSSGSAKYEVVFSFKDGTKESLTETTDIVKVDGKWYFSYFQSGTSSFSSGAQSGSTATYTPAPPPTPTPKPDYGPVPVNTKLSASDVDGEMYTFQGQKQDGSLGWGIMNAHGTVIISPFFQKIKSCGDDFLVSMDSKYWGVVDLKGNMLVDYDLLDAESLWNGYISYKDSDSGLRALYSIKTGHSTPFIYQELGHEDENHLFSAQKDGLWGMIDENGNVKVDFQYQEIGADITLDGLYLARKGQYYGFFDTEGNTRVDFRYDDTCIYSGDLVAVALNGAWGLVDGYGKEILPLEHNRTFIKYNSGENTFFVSERNKQTGSDYEWCVNVYSCDGNLLASVPCSKYEALNKGKITVKQRSEIYHDGYVDRYLLIDGYGNTLFDTEPVMHYAIDAYLSNHPERVNAYYHPGVNLSQIAYSGYLLLTVSLQDMGDNEKQFLILDNSGALITQGFLSSGSVYPDVFLSKDGARLYVTSSDLRGLNANKTTVYAFPDMTPLAELPFPLSELHEYGENIIGKEGDTKKYRLIDRSGNIQQQYTYYDGYAIGDAGSYAILSDGIYYGVLTDTGFVGKGVAYTEKPTCNSRTFVLSDGARQEFYRYNPDGTVTPLS